MNHTIYSFSQMQAFVECHSCQGTNHDYLCETGDELQGSLVNYHLERACRSGRSPSKLLATLHVLSKYRITDDACSYGTSNSTPSHRHHATVIPDCSQAQVVFHAVLYFLPDFLIPCDPAFMGPLPLAFSAISLLALAAVSHQPPCLQYAIMLVDKCSFTSFLLFLECSIIFVHFLFLLLGCF